MLFWPAPTVNVEQASFIDSAKDVRCDEIVMSIAFNKDALSHLPASVAYHNSISSSELWYHSGGSKISDAGSTENFCTFAGAL